MSLHSKNENDSLTAPAPAADWDIYWQKKKGSAGTLYNVIAVFYRNFIIKPYLNLFLKKYFHVGAKVLHAGCGSGRVDSDIIQWLNVTAMDISFGAVALYKKSNPNAGKVIRADILNTPFADETFSGIYNLGVMEHFTVKEIQKILGEFKRILKPKGRIVLFWPPEFGLSVRVLNFVHYIANNVFKKSLQLHPAEISLIKNKDHIISICGPLGLTIIGYHFGLKDLCTQVVVVLEKNSAQKL